MYWGTCTRSEGKPGVAYVCVSRAKTAGVGQRQANTVPRVSSSVIAAVQCQGLSILIVMWNSGCPPEVVSRRVSSSGAYGAGVPP
eukprot:682849-Hanusia_phi.AAC.1